MNKEVNKTEPQNKPKPIETAQTTAESPAVLSTAPNQSENTIPQAPALDPAILAAIQAAVTQSVSATVQAVMSQLAPKPQAQPANDAPSALVNPNAPAPGTNGNYVSKLKGIPVQPGQDLRHVHPSVIQGWFNTVESRWKEQYNKRKMGGAPVDMSWTRG
jgi:hypothetical protein